MLRDAKVGCHLIILDANPYQMFSSSASYLATVTKEPLVEHFQRTKEKRANNYIHIASYLAYVKNRINM